MFPVLLADIKTRDGVTLHGFFVHPQRTKTGVLFIHGLSGNFYRGAMRQALAEYFKKENIAFASFNTRGHDVVNTIRKGRKTMLGGAGFEYFKDSVYDLAAGVQFLMRNGCRDIFLLGHSTGANKALYYMNRTKDRRVKGLILAGPLSDVLGKEKELGRKLPQLVEKFKKMARNKKLADQPVATDLFVKRGISTTVISPQRFLSLYTHGSTEDVFPYGDPKAKWKELHSVKNPVMVVVGKKDQHLDRSAKSLVESFQKNARRSKHFSGIIIKNADHGFAKKEKELAKVIVDWIKKIK